MSGPNQHHIPQFYQRGFGVKPRGQRPKEIWVYRAGQSPNLQLISETGSADFFYSQPSHDGAPTLDDTFKLPENRISTACADLRSQPIGSPVDPLVAADIVTHLAPRSSHIRSSLASGIQQLVEGARDVFTDRAQVEQLLGLDRPEPSDHFRAAFQKATKDRPEMAALGLPQPVLERVAFYIAKESFDKTVADTVPMFGAILRQMSQESASLAREGHNRSLENLEDGVNVRRILLQSFNWSVEQAPMPGAVLPDCVALAYEPCQPALPLMFVGQHMSAAVIPLSKEKLLVGRKSDSVVCDLAGFNGDAAACSHEFFLAHEDAEEFRRLADQIGVQSDAYFQSAMEAGFEQMRPTDNAPHHIDEVPPRAYAPNDDDLLFSYTLSCLGVVDESFARRLSESLKPYVTAFGGMMPLSRLESLVFASDYGAALHGVDRGRPDLPPAETTSSDNLVGIARMVIVEREGKAKACIVMDLSVGASLIGDDQQARDWAVHVLIHQLVLVAVLELIERTMPGRLLEPIEGALAGMLYREVDAAINGYMAAFTAAPLGDTDEIGNLYLTMLCSSLDEMKVEIEAARLAYRYDADLDKLVSVAMPRVGRVLYFAAEYIGNRFGAARALLDEGGQLSAALRRTNLANWLADFALHLESIRERMGAWRSFDEFLAFNRHVERLLWSVGLFPWEGPDGLRVEVPLISDAAALLGEQVQDQ